MWTQIIQIVSYVEELIIKLCSLLTYSPHVLEFHERYKTALSLALLLSNTAG